MRLSLFAVLAIVAACGPSDSPHGNGPDAAPHCEGADCTCEQRGLPATTVSGTVYAPNGTLALFGVNVYIPKTDPGPLAAGLQCEHCMDELPGGSVSRTTSGEHGEFTMQDGVVPGVNVPLVVQVGRWRKQVVIPEVRECQDNLVEQTMTTLPKTKAEGDMPKIAIVTGQYDSLECLVRKIGVADAEFTTDTGAGQVHLYASNGANQFTDGTMFGTGHSLWSDAAKMKGYDFALFSCEGNVDPTLVTSKTQAEMDNVQAFADAGGRLFMSHYHNIWIDGRKNPQSGDPAPSAAWQSTMVCSDMHPLTNTTIDAVIDQMHNPKGPSFARWLQNVGGSSALGTVTVNDARQTCDSADLNKVEQWAYTPGTAKPQVVQFTTPITQAPADRCGKVVFSDMHVASGSSSLPGDVAASGTPFPMGCSTTALSPQEKALAFMFFDIASCVGPIL
ncbi:MAG TPA: hypothetical protein VGM90_25070 [Kofleriaceae bacterium]|jgi:hypothetical protein